MVQLLCKTVWQFVIKRNMYLFTIYNPAISSLGIYPREMKAYIPIKAPCESSRMSDHSGARQVWDLGPTGNRGRKMTKARCRRVEWGGLGAGSNPHPGHAPTPCQSFWGCFLRSHTEFHHLVEPQQVSVPKTQTSNKSLFSEPLRTSL